MQEVGTQEGDEENQTSVHRNSFGTICPQAGLDNGKVEVAEKEYDGAAHVVVSAVDGRGHDSKHDPKTSPQEHEKTNEDLVSDVDADVGRELEKCPIRCVVGPGTSEDEGPETCECHVCVPEHGAELRTGLLLEEVVASGGSNEAGHEDELTTLQGEAKVGGREDAEGDEPPEEPTRKSHDISRVVHDIDFHACWVQIVGPVRGDHNDEGDEDIDAENGLDNHSHLNGVGIEPAEDEASDADEQSQQPKEDLCKPADEEGDAIRRALRSDIQISERLHVVEADSALDHDADTPYNEEPSGLHEGHAKREWLRGRGRRRHHCVNWGGSRHGSGLGGNGGGHCVGWGRRRRGVEGRRWRAGVR